MYWKSLDASVEFNFQRMEQFLYKDKYAKKPTKSEGLGKNNFSSQKN